MSNQHVMSYLLQQHYAQQTHQLVLAQLQQAKKAPLPRPKLSFGVDAILATDDNETSDASSKSSLSPVRAPPVLPQPTAQLPYAYAFHQQLALASAYGSSFVNSLDRHGRIQKSKRNRTVFTNDQLDKLEQVFARSKYLVGTERTALATELGLNETQVKVWFQNRRIKYRKQNKIEKVDSLHDSSNCSGSDEDECPDVTKC